MSAIVVNTIALAAPFQGMPPSYSSGLEYLNDGLAALFTAEMALKIFAFGPRAYFMDPWSQFDAAVVVLSDVGIILTLAGGLSIGAIGTLARVLRLGRVVRLAKALKSLRQMVSTLILVMPQLFNVGERVLSAAVLRRSDALLTGIRCILQGYYFSCSSSYMPLPVSSYLPSSASTANTSSHSQTFKASAWAC